MRHFINILVLLLLFAACAGVAFLSADKDGRFSLLYVPLVFFLTVWGIKLFRDY